MCVCVSSTRVQQCVRACVCHPVRADDSTLDRVCMGNYVKDWESDMLD